MKSLATSFSAVLLLAFSGLLTSCSDDEPDPPATNVYTIDTFNVALAGSFVPYEAERTDPVTEAVASMETDILCVQEAWRGSDKDRIEAASKKRFPYTVRFEHGFETPLDDPEDQTGSIPPANTTPPCAGDTQALFEEVMQCLVDNCSTIPGSVDGKAVSATCAEEACFIQAAQLLTGDEQARRCYGCAVTSLPEDSFGVIRDKCTTKPNASLAFDGQSGVMILSKYPLVEAEDWVLPGTWNRRVILRATAKLPNGVDLDVYCNHLTAVFFGPAFPYTGEYGEGEVGPEGWAAEQKLQVEKLIAYVSKHSAGRRAVVLGDFNTGHEYRVDDRMVMRAEGEEAIGLLESHYEEALVADYVPACTFCSSNPLTGLTKEWESAWVDHIFLQGIPKEAVISSIRTLEEEVVMVETGETSEELKVPVSDHYGMRTTLELIP